MNRYITAGKMSVRVVGRHVAAKMGLRVRMMEGFRNQGAGTVTSVHANGGYCAVQWDSGAEDKVSREA